MKKYIKELLILSAILFVGCGGDSSYEDISGAYTNKKLPTIEKNTIPDLLIVKDTSMGKVFRKIGDKGYGLELLKNEARFFYQKQLDMNMNLGYIDSIWNQVEEYCKFSDMCEIPNEKIIFTYTESLYKRDIKLLNEHMKKMKDKYRIVALKDNLKQIVGKKFKLGPAKLIIHKEGIYKYELITREKKGQEDGIYAEKSTVKWNEENKRYSIKEEINIYTENNISVEFKYEKKEAEKLSIFLINGLKERVRNKILELKEKEEKIYFKQTSDIYEMSFDQKNPTLRAVTEGYLGDSGGRLTRSDQEGVYKETFDSEGNTLTTIDCLPSNISDKMEDDFCKINDPSIVKGILSKNFYSLSLSFQDIGKYPYDALPNPKSAIKFYNDNRLHAVIDCSVFDADYKVSNRGIKFSNIRKTVSEDLKCLYNSVEKNFEDFLKKEYLFPEDGFNSAYGLWPTFDKIRKSDFNFEDFNQALYINKYVDSPLMNSVFRIHSASFMTNYITNHSYRFENKPKIKIVDDVITIELVDVTFEALVEVVDIKHIRFKNVHRYSKNNVVYLTEDEKIFASVIENFLKDIVSVIGTGIVDFRGKELRFKAYTSLDFEEL